MLSRASTHIAKNIPGPYGPTDLRTYVLYPDTDKPNTYYVLPETPTFLPMSGGKGPSFNMLWWYGTGNTVGGICTFTVALPMPDWSRTDVRDALTLAVNDDPDVREYSEKVFGLAKAYAANDAVAIEQYLKALEIKDAEGRALTHSFDATRGSEQFRPATKQKLDFLAVELTKGAVTVQGFKSAKVANDPLSVEFDGTFATTPSRLSSNAAVVTFNLDQRNATLMWQAMGGPPFAGLDALPDRAELTSSVITVKYAVEFDGMLPGAEAIVTLRKESVAKVLTEQKSSYSSWSGKRTWDEVVGKDYRTLARDSMEVRIPSSQYSAVPPGGTKSVKDVLTDWASAQLVSMLAAQLPDIKLSDLMTGKKDSITQVQDQSRTYKLSTAIGVARNPQGMLPKVNGLVQRDTLDNYFSTIDLNRVPWVDVTVTVNPLARARMKTNKIGAIALKRLNFGSNRLRTADNLKRDVTVLPFEAEGSGALSQVQLLGQFGIKEKDAVVSYDYEVSYTDGTPTYRVDNNTLPQGKTNVDLSGADLGVLQKTLDAQWLPWGLISSARLDVQYADLYQSTFMLTKDNAKAEIVKPLGRKIDQNLQYRLTLNMTSGTPVAYPAAADAWAEVNREATGLIPLRSPLGDAGLTEAIFNLDTDVTSATSRVEYAMELPGGIQRLFSKVIRLDAAKKATDTWSVATPVNADATFTFKKLKVRNGQAEQPLDDQIETPRVTNPEFTFGMTKVEVL